MKRMRLAAFLAVVLLLSGCGAKEETTVDLTAFFDRLDQSYAWGETYFMEQDEESLDSLYPGLKDLPAKQLVVKVPRMSAAVNEYVFAEFETEKDAEAAGEILRNGYYRIAANITGLVGQDCVVSVSVADWETPVTQSVELGA